MRMEGIWKAGGGGVELCRRPGRRGVLSVCTGLHRNAQANTCPARRPRSLWRWSFTGGGRLGEVERPMATPRPTRKIGLSHNRLRPDHFRFANLGFGWATAHTAQRSYAWHNDIMAWLLWGTAPPKSKPTRANNIPKSYPPV